MVTVDYAPSKIKWLTSRSLYHLPVIRSYAERRELTQFVQVALNSAKHEQDFLVIDSGWARKKSNSNDETILQELTNIDSKIGNYIYGDIPQSRHWSRVYEYPYALYQLKHVPEAGRLLDCGCGATSFQFYLAEQGFEVYGVDDWLPSLERVASFKKELGLINLKPTFGSIVKLPFADLYFDGATCISVLEHALLTSEKTKAILKGCLNELLRVLKRQARLILTFDVNFGSENRHLTFNEYLTLCDTLGIKPTSLPEDRLYSSDTKEGLLTGRDLAVYSVTIVKN